MFCSAQKIVIPSTDPTFRPLEEQFLLFPMTHKDYDNWNSHGTAVLLKNKAVITPGIENLKGVLYNTKPIPTSAVEGWEAHIDIEMGCDEAKQISSGGIGLYYLRNVELDSNAAGLYGYTNKFNGAAVIITTYFKQRKEVEHGIEFQPSI